MRGQLSLFERAPEAAVPGGTADLRWARQLAEQHAQARMLALQLPPGVRFGTSSWSFPGWAGLVYGARRPQAVLARDGLREYAAHPLLTTVGIDRSYYAPIPIEDLRRYADQLPDGFRCAIKAPASVTACALGGHDPIPNPEFLSPARLVDDLLAPCALAFAAHTGPVIIECPPAPPGMRVDPSAFAERLDACLSQLPDQFTYAVELRDRSLLTPAYAAVLARHGASHTYNYWSGMPMPVAQAVVVPPEAAATAAPLVVRLLLRPGTRYATRREAFHPFDRLVEPDFAMRAETLSLVRRATAVGRQVFVLVNNKAEGSSPLTILALAKQLAASR